MNWAGKALVVLVVCLGVAWVTTNDASAMVLPVQAVHSVQSSVAWPHGGLVKLRKGHIAAQAHHIIGDRRLPLSVLPIAEASPIAPHQLSLSIVILYTLGLTLCGLALYVQRKFLTGTNTRQPADLQFGALLISFGRLKTTGSPTFWRPSPVDGLEWNNPQYDPTLPTMYYLPGMDGTGFGAKQQFPKLIKHFNLWCMTIPVADRTSFDGLVDYIVEFVEAEAAKCDAQGPPKPIYLLGESFGGALALAVAAKCMRINRLVLVNPSTSFMSSFWPDAGPLVAQTPEAVYPLLALLVGPLLANPVTLALAEVDRKADFFTQFRQLSNQLLGGVTASRTLAEVLPPATLEHKLQLLQNACEVLTDEVLCKVKARVLLFGSGQDLLLPSVQEVRRLEQRLPIAKAKVVAGRSHAMLQEAGIDLMKMLEDEGFYARNLILSGRLGASTTIELPTVREAELTASSVGFDLLGALLSPVFLSVGQDGTVQRGFKAMNWDKRPILIVGNHQTMAPDSGILIKEVLQSEGILLRGLAHPAMSVTSPAAGQDAAANGFGLGRLGGLFRSYGALTVSGRNLYNLLSNNEVVLLYPGGVREIYKQRGEEYQVIWPETPEFVRIAARFGATIIPLSAIGVDDSVEMLLDGKELMDLPFIGDVIKQRSSEVPLARPTKGPEDFVAPLVVPKVTEIRRFYFLFGKPIVTSPNMDRHQCAAVYKEVKESINAGIKWLLEKREEDPYQYIGPRLVYETTWGKQAPTFASPEGSVGSSLISTPGYDDVEVPTIQRETQANPLPSASPEPPTAAEAASAVNP